MPNRPFRFSTGVYKAATRQELISLARKIEDLGYDTCVAPDHFTFSLSTSVSLMAIADATKSLRISSYVYDNDFRHPALLAAEAAALDALSDGRFEFGIGAGWSGYDYATTGILFDPPGVRVGRLIESVQIIKRLLAGEKLTFKGTYYTITDLQNFPPAVQTPHPPLMIGGGGKRTLSLAAREANIVSILMRAAGGTLDITSATTAATTQRVQWIREAAGERFDSLELNTLVFEVIITDQRQQIAEERARDWSGTAEHLLDSTHFLIGTIDQITEDVQRWREQFGISYVTVAQEFMDAFAPVVARLAGS